MHRRHSGFAHLSLPSCPTQPLSLPQGPPGRALLTARRAASPSSVTPPAPWSASSSSTARAPSPSSPSADPATPGRTSALLLATRHAAPSSPCPSARVQRAPWRLSAPPRSRCVGSGGWGAGVGGGKGARVCGVRVARLAPLVSGACSASRASRVCNWRVRRLSRPSCLPAGACGASRICTHTLRSPHPSDLRREEGRRECCITPGHPSRPLRRGLRRRSDGSGLEHEARSDAFSPS